MKKLTLILSLLATQLFGQLSVEDSLKIEKMQDFILDHIGKRVGSGLCFDLVDKTIMQVNRKWKKASKGKRVYVYGERLKGDDIKSLRPGDVIVGHNHVGIVAGYDVNTDELIVAHQNVGVDRLKDSRVVLWSLSGFMKITDENKFRYYRPILSKK